MWPDDSDLTVRVRAAFGANLASDPVTWVWTDLSDRMTAELIQVREGRSAGARTASPGTCTVSLLNDDGALTPQNPMSSYWPFVELDTPLWVEVFWGGVWHDRFRGFADQWQPTFTPTTDGTSRSSVRITASGLTRRLTQGEQPTKSALFRAVAKTSPVAYWPLEDGPDSTQAAAVASTAAPLKLDKGSVRFAGTDGPAGSDSLADFSEGGTMTGVVPPAAHTTSWRVEFVTLFREFQPGTFGAVLQIYVGGTIDFWEIDANPDVDGGLYMQYVTKAGGFGDAYSYVKVDDGRWHHIRVEAVQSGGNINFFVSLDGAPIIFMAVAGTMGAVSRVVINPTGDVVEEVPSLGHLTVWAPWAGGTDTVAAAIGYPGETAKARIARLCAEEGVPVTLSASTGDPQGPQPVDTFMGLLRQVEETDLGILTEEGWGFHYVARADRYNVTPAMTIDLVSYLVQRGDSRGVLVPTFDDASVVNEVTVTRVRGSSATAVNLTNPRLARRAGTADVNVVSDGVLLDQASWRAYLGGMVGLREQTFPVDLAANPGLVDAWLPCGVGSRIVRTNPPAVYGPGPLDMLVEGWTESIGPRSWMVQVTPTPAEPWDVATVDGDPRMAADGSTLAAALTSSGMSLVLASTPANGPWSQDAADFPLAIKVGGEQVTASVIAPAVSDDFSRVVPPGGWGGPWTTAVGSASVASVNTFAILDVPALLADYVQVVSGLSARDFEVEVGAIYLATAPTGSGAYARAVVYLRWQNSSNYLALFLHLLPSGAIDMQLNRVSAGSFTTLAAATSPTPFAAGVSLKVRVAADGADLRARVWTFGTRDPLSWQIVATDPAPVAGTVGLGALLVAATNPLPYRVVFDGFTVIRPQLVTLSARHVNGVQRAWPASTPVDVTEPAIVPL